MHDPQLFRRQLAVRILGLLGAASLAVHQGACTSDHATRASAGTGGSSGATTTASSGGDAGAGATTGTGGAGTGGAGAGGGGGAGGGNPDPPIVACFDVLSSPDGGADGGADSGADGGDDGGADSGADGGDDGGADAGMQAGPGYDAVFLRSAWSAQSRRTGRSRGSAGAAGRWRGRWSTCRIHFPRLALVFHLCGCRS